MLSTLYQGLEGHDGRFKDVELANEDNKKLIDEIDGQLGLFKKEINSRISNFSNSVEGLRKEVKNAPDQKQFKGIRSEFEDLLAYVKSMSEAFEKLKTSNETVLKDIDRLQNKLGKKFSAKASSMASPNREIKVAGYDEKAFVNYWKAQLKNTPLCNLETDELMVHHIFFKLFSCFILFDRLLFESWLKALGWTQFQSAVVAEPTWTSSNDSKSMAGFFQSEDTPQVLKILNFNHAVPEGYLHPQLLPWLDSSPSSDSKVALVIDTQDLDSMSSLIQFLPCIISVSGKLDPSPILKAKESRSNVDEKPILISSLSIWNTHDNAKYVENADVLNLAKSQGVEIAPIILSNYNRLYVALCEYFDHSSAVLASFDLTIFPWIRFTKGEVYAEQIYRNLSEL